MDSRLCVCLSVSEGCEKVSLFDDPGRERGSEIHGYGCLGNCISSHLLISIAPVGSRLDCDAAGHRTPSDAALLLVSSCVWSNFPLLVGAERQMGLLQLQF